MTLALQNEAKIAGHEHPLFIGIDQENGFVTRISPPVAAQVPGPMALGATNSAALAHDAGKATGETLDFFGINMNYAPVCDINSEPLNPVIGVRSPGDGPEFVGRLPVPLRRVLGNRKLFLASNIFLDMAIPRLILTTGFQLSQKPEISWNVASWCHSAEQWLKASRL